MRASAAAFTIITVTVVQRKNGQGSCISIIVRLFVSIVQCIRLERYSRDSLMECSAHFQTLKGRPLGIIKYG